MEREQKEFKQREAAAQAEKDALVADIERTIGTKLRWAEDETERLAAKTAEQLTEMDRLKALVAKKDDKILDVLREKQQLEAFKLENEAVCTH